MPLQTRLLALAMLMAVSIVAASSSVSQATTTDLVRYVNQALGGTTGPLPPARRLEIAIALRNYWQSYSMRIPRLSPSEEAWVLRELDSNDIDRIVAILQRREGAQYRLYKNAEACVDLHNRIVLLDRQNTTSEAKAWLWAFDCYRDASQQLDWLFVSRLISQRRHDAEFNTTFVSFWGQTVVSIARNLLP